MNLFVLHTSQESNAQHHVDKHVVKMPLEATQILCTVMRERCGIDYGYKSTYVNHPIVQWAGACFLNFLWTLDYGAKLFYEYSYRFHKQHKSQEVLYGIQNYWDQISESLGNGDRTPHHLAVSPELKDAFKQYGDLEPVYAYRAYYLRNKRRLFKWTNRPTPSWIVDPNYEIRDYI